MRNTYEKIKSLAETKFPDDELRLEPSQYDREKIGNILDRPPRKRKLAIDKMVNEIKEFDSQFGEDERLFKLVRRLGAVVKFSEQPGNFKAKKAAQELGVPLAEACMEQLNMTPRQIVQS